LNERHHLLTSGHDINFRDDDGRTALYVAVYETYYALGILGADQTLSANEQQPGEDAFQAEPAYQE